MGVLEGLAQRAAYARHVAVRERPGLGQLRQRAARHELGHEIEVVLVRPQLVEGHDPGVVQPGGGARLAFRPLVAVLARDDLHGHVALELLVARLPNRTEAAGPEAALSR